MPIMAPFEVMLTVDNRLLVGKSQFFNLIQNFCGAHGCWSLCDKSQDVILDRSRAREGVTLNPLVRDRHAAARVKPSRTRTVDDDAWTGHLERSH